MALTDLLTAWLIPEFWEKVALVSGVLYHWSAQVSSVWEENAPFHFPIHPDHVSDSTVPHRRISPSTCTRLLSNTSCRQIQKFSSDEGQEKKRYLLTPCLIAFQALVSLFTMRPLCFLAQPPESNQSEETDCKEGQMLRTQWEREEERAVFFCKIKETKHPHS